MKNKIFFTGFLFLFTLFLFSSINPKLQDPDIRGGRGKIIAEKPAPGEDDVLNLNIVTKDIDGVVKHYYVGEICPDSNSDITRDKKFQVLMCNFPCWFNFGCKEGDYVEYIVKGNKIEIIGFIQDTTYHN